MKTEYRETGGKALAFLFLVLSLDSVFLASDLMDDWGAGEFSLLHSLSELLPFLLNIAGLVYISLRWRGAREDMKNADRRAADAEIRALRTATELDHWQKKTESLTYGLAQAIDSQLSAWGLSSAEKDISLLLLKGLSSKEIAELRSTSERTVRQQAGSIYQKAGLAGRSELSAFFLEDLLTLQPQTTGPASG